MSRDELNGSTSAAMSMLVDLRRGATLAELDEKLAELVEAVRGTGKPGRAILELRIKPASKGSGNVLMIEDTLRVVSPTLDRETTVMFADKENRLSRKDPDQLTLDDLREVAEPTPHQRPQLREVK